MPELKVLDIPPNLYTTEELARIVALRPDISGRSLTPYIKIEMTEKGFNDVFICGKRKPFLHSKKDGQECTAL